MAKTTLKIIRTSIHTFLKNYNFFTTTSFLSLPFSASILITSSLSPEYSTAVRLRLLSIFSAAGISPLSGHFFTVKLSQTITTSTLLLPFTFSFLLITKTTIIQSLHTRRKNPPPFAGVLHSVVKTQLYNSFLIISANATCFWTIFIAVNCFQNLVNMFSIPSLSLMAGITYAVVVANAMIVCNMALVLSGMECKGGFFSILKAFVMVKSRTSTALSLAIYSNLAMAGIEALFQFRVASSYFNSRTRIPSSSMVLEGLFIAYLYSIVITLDTISGCVFYTSCKFEACKKVFDQEKGRRHGYCLEVQEEEEDLD